MRLWEAAFDELERRWLEAFPPPRMVVCMHPMFMNTPLEVRLEGQSAHPRAFEEFMAGSKQTRTDSEDSKFAALLAYEAALYLSIGKALLHQLDGVVGKDETLRLVSSVIVPNSALDSAMLKLDEDRNRKVKK